MFRFKREGNLGGRRALASAAAALIDDDTSGGAPAPKPGEEPVIADGAQTGGEGDGGDTDGEANTDDAGTGDGSSVETPAANTGADDDGDDGANAGDQHSEASLAAGRAQMAERIETVFASDECKGRESAAASLLAADLSSDRVVAMLGKLPKGAAADAMLSRLASEASAAPVVAPGAAEKDTGPKADVWGNAHKRAGLTK